MNIAKFKTMTQEMKTKREELKANSRIIQMAVKSGMYDSVNEGLADMYAKEGHTTLHSFKHWLTEGYVVRKGEKALLLWAQPRTAPNKEKQTADDKDEFSFFPVAFVFSQLQVEPLLTKHHTR